MLILGIESSCDETGVALVEWDALAPAHQVPTLLAHALHSQVSMHEAFGGVVPELASRAHQEQIVVVVDAALNAAHLSKQDLDAIAFTQGPGLLGSLTVDRKRTRLNSSHIPLSRMPSSA